MLNETEEKIVLTFSLKNCKINHYYKISVGDYENDNFETEWIFTENMNEITFKEKMHYNFLFEKKQKLNIITSTCDQYNFKKNNFDEYERITVLSSLIISKGCIYERKISTKYDSEVISIEIDKEENLQDKKYLS